MTDDVETRDEVSEEELARLADGSLDPARRERLTAAVAATPHLAEALAEQRRAVELLGAAQSVRAPETLREHVRVATAPRRRARSRRRGLRPVMIGALALALVAVVSAGRERPTMGQAVQAALAGASRPAPAVDPADPARLSLAVDGISFPAWGAPQGWWASGSRTETAGAGRVTAVYYTGAGGARIGYAIVGGPAVGVPRGQAMSWNGVTYTVLRSADVTAVTWRRSGHTCVIAGRRVPAAVLLTLARAA